MNKLISKELLSLVLDTKIEKFKIVEEDNMMYFGYTSLNLDTLGRLCKEWALKEGYCLVSSIHDNNNYESKYCICEIMKPVYGSSSLYFPQENTIGSDTEPEAIFKACQWILEKEAK